MLLLTHFKEKGSGLKSSVRAFLHGIGYCIFLRDDRFLVLISYIIKKCDIINQHFVILIALFVENFVHIHKI